MQRSRLSALLLVLMASTCVGASCDHGSEQGGNGAASSGDSAERRVASLEGVDVSQLTEPEQAVWTDLVNDLLSPCGDPVSVGLCAAERRDSCPACVTAARYLERLVREGYERIEIEEHYRGRFGQDTEHAFDLEGSPVRGARMAAVTIVEFSDFQCPYCAAAQPMLKRALRQFEGKVKLVFKHYPLPGHPRAMPAAKAAEAARLQGEFWPMHDKLFEHQHALGEEDLQGYAKALELDMDEFEEDRASRAVAKRIERDVEEAKNAGVSSTPSLFINGRKYRESPRNLDAYLEEELQL